MRKRALTFFGILVFAFCVLRFAPTDVFAKRTLPQVAPPKAATTGASKAVPSVQTKGVGVSVKLRSDRRAVVATFTNLGVAKSVSYQLTYRTGRVNEGAGGSLSSLSQDPAVRELLFGTCSKGVCRYHTGITNAKFTVTTTLKNGAKIVKPFRLKV